MNEPKQSTSTATQGGASKDRKAQPGARPLVPFFINGNEINEKHHIPHDVAELQQQLLVPNGKVTFNVREFKDGYFTEKSNNIKKLVQPTLGQGRCGNGGKTGRAPEIQIVQQPAHLAHVTINTRNHETFQLDPASASPSRSAHRDMDRHYKNYEQMMMGAKSPPPPLPPPLSLQERQPQSIVSYRAPDVGRKRETLLQSAEQQQQQQQQQQKHVARQKLAPQQVNRSIGQPPLQQQQQQQDPKYKVSPPQSPPKQLSHLHLVPLLHASLQVSQQPPTIPTVNSTLPISQQAKVLPLPPPLPLQQKPKQPSEGRAPVRRLLTPSFFTNDEEQQPLSPKAVADPVQHFYSAHHNQQPVTPPPSQHQRITFSYPVVGVGNGVAHGDARSNPTIPAQPVPLPNGMHTPSPQKNPDSNLKPLTEEDILAPYLPKQLFAGHSFGSSPDPKSLPMPRFK